MADTQLGDALIRQLHVTVRAFTKGVSAGHEAPRPVQLRVGRPQLRRQSTPFPIGHRAALEIEGAAISKTLSKMEQKRTHRADEQPGQTGKTHFLTERAGSCTPWQPRPPAITAAPS